MTTMMVGTISICMTVLVLNVHHRAPRVVMPPPAWLKTFMLYHVARLVFVQTHYRLQRRKNSASKWSLLRHKTKTPAQPVNVFKTHNSSQQQCETTNGDILDEMENMGLTAVLHNRCPNGPSRVDFMSDSNGAGTCHKCSDNHVGSNDLRNDLRNQNNSSCHPPTGLNLPNRRASAQLPRRRGLHDTSPMSDVTDDDLDRYVMDRYSRDWHEVAHVLDRFFFWVLLILMTFSTVVILFYPQYSGLEKVQMDIS